MTQAGHALTARRGPSWPPGREMPMRPRFASGRPVRTPARSLAGSVMPGGRRCRGAGRCCRSASSSWSSSRPAGDHRSTLVFRPRVGELLRQHGRACSCSTMPAARRASASALAWLVERTDLPGRALWPCCSSRRSPCRPSSTAIAWVIAVPRCTASAARVLIAMLSYYPLVYLPVAATLRRLDPALEEAARRLGRGPWRVFAGVVLPQLRLRDAGRRAARRPAPARRVRALRDAPLRHVHDGDHRPVPVDLQRPGGHVLAGVLVRAAVLACCCSRYVAADGGRLRPVGVGRPAARTAARALAGPASRPPPPSPCSSRLAVGVPDAQHRPLAEPRGHRASGRRTTSCRHSSRRRPWLLGGAVAADRLALPIAMAGRPVSARISRTARATQLRRPAPCRASSSRSPSSRSPSALAQPLYQTVVGPRARLRPAVPAARPDQPAARSRRRRSGSTTWPSPSAAGPLSRCVRVDAAADRARPRRRRGPGLPRHRHRADRDPAARPRSAPGRWRRSSGRHAATSTTRPPRPTPALMVVLSIAAGVAPAPRLPGIDGP